MNDICMKGLINMVLIMNISYIDKTLPTLIITYKKL